MQHRPTGEYTMDRVGSVAQHVADVVVGVAGSVHDLQPDWTRVDDIAVSCRSTIVGDVVADRHHVLGSDGARQLQTTRDVVVVNVCLQYMGDRHATVVGQRQDPVDVALGVDDYGSAVVAYQVTAVT